MENGKEKGEIGEFCIFCRNWAGFDKKEQVIAGGEKVYRQNIRYCEKHQKETDRRDVCRDYVTDWKFMNNLRRWGLMKKIDAYRLKD